MTLPAKQQGMTLIGFIFVLAFLLAIAYLAIKIAPHYLSYYSIVDAMQKVSLEPGIENQPTSVIRNKLTQVLYVNYVEGLEPHNLRVERTGAGRQIVLDYEVRESIVGNLSVCIHFENTLVL